MNPLHSRRRSNDTLPLPDALRVRLDALFDALTPASPTSFRFAGAGDIDLASAAPERPGGDVAHALAERMLPLVYTQAYARPWRGGELVQPESAPAPAAFVPFAPGAAFLASLSAAHRGQTRMDAGWRIYQLGTNGAVHVQKGEVCRLVPPGEYVFTGGPGRAPGVGDVVELLVLRDAQLLQPGFYFVFGETVGSEFDEAHLARLYFHMRPEGMPWLVEMLSGELNRYAVPFRFKCLSTPAAYARTDAAVLYVARRFLDITLRVLAAHSDGLQARLQPSVPLFTKELLPGLGAADEPGTGESFGQSRCRLVCLGIVDAWLRGLHTREARLQAVSERFSLLGLSLARPYLNEGMEDSYEWPVDTRADA